MKFWFPDLIFSTYLLVTSGKSITYLCFLPTGCKASKTIFLTVFKKNNYNVCNLVILVCQNRKLLTKTEVIVSLVNCCCVCVCVSHQVVSHSLQPHGLQPARLLCPWNSPGKNTGVGSHSLLQGIFPDPRTEAGSPLLQEYSLPSEPPGKL